MRWDLLFNTLNENMVQYLTGSYGILAMFYILTVFIIVYMMDLGLKYALVFTLPVGIFFIGIGWFGAGLTQANLIWNMVMVIIAFMLGLALLKWLGDW